MRILYKVSDKIKTLFNLYGNWYFVDYATEDIPIGKYKEIKIIEVLDQFGNKLENIPIGWKTIAKIEGINFDLEVSDTWKSNINYIEI